MNIEFFIRQHLPGYSTKQINLPFPVEDIEIEAKTILRSFGQIEDRIYFLREGAVQVSILRGDEERILEFVFPGHFFCAYTSFLLQEASDVEVFTLARCQVSCIRRMDLIAAAASSLLAAQLCGKIAEQLFLSRARREKDFLTLSAEERYKALFEKGPEIIKNIPVNKIAKYLGIQPESLSRIRKEIIP